MVLNYIPENTTPEEKKKIVKKHTRYNYIKAGKEGVQQEKEFEKISAREEKEEKEITHVGDVAFKNKKEAAKSAPVGEVSSEKSIPVSMENTKKEILAFADNTGVEVNPDDNKRTLLDTIKAEL